MFKKLLYILGLGEVTAKCGHKTKITERVEIIDENGNMITGNIENTKNPDLCIDCYRQQLNRKNRGGDLNNGSFSRKKS